MKKILIVILVIALAAPAVGFKDDDKTKVIPRMPGGGGYCVLKNSECPVEWYYDGSEGRWVLIQFKCREVGVMPPYIEHVEWVNGGTCGRLEVTFDGGQVTYIDCICIMDDWMPIEP